MSEARIKKLLAEKADIIEHTGRELAMNFDIPAKDIIAMACGKLGITKRDWDAIQAYRVAQQL